MVLLLSSAVGPSVRTLSCALSSVRLPPAVRTLSSSSSARALSDDNQSPSGATPARLHRRGQVSAQADQQADEGPRRSSGGTGGGARSSADALADLAQGLGQSGGSGSLPTRARASGFAPKSSNASAAAAALAAQVNTRLPRDPPKAPEEPLAPSGYSSTRLPLREDPLLVAFVGNLMKDGKKARAQRQILDTLKSLAETMHADPLPVMYEAVRLTSPLVRLASRKQGGKVLQIPMPLFPRPSRRRGIKAILDACNKRPDNKLHVRLAKEIIAVLEGTSSALARKLEVHRLAAVNRSNTGVRV